MKPAGSSRSEKPSPSEPPGCVAGGEVLGVERPPAGWWDAGAEEAGTEEEIPDVEDVEDVEDIGDDDSDVFLEEDEDEEDDLDFDVGGGSADER